MKLKDIKQRGDKGDSRRLMLLKRRKVLVDKISKINMELHLGRKLDIFEALARKYNVNLLRKGRGGKVGGRISTPLCLAGKRVKLSLVKEVKDADKL